MTGPNSIEAAMLASLNAAARSADARDRVAETIAEEIRARPDADQVAPEVMSFLLGPWAHVVAQARISNQRGASDADGFAALIPVLIWSAQPELTRKNLPMLARQVPKLVAKLREGLATIQRSEADSAPFFSELMGLHEQVLRPEAYLTSVMAELDTQPDAIRPATALPSHLRPAPARPDSVDLADVEVPMDAELSEPAPDAPLAVGGWVELRGESEWTRTQLTWANPGGTLFLFTSAAGGTQSMTRRSLDKLLASGKMRAVPGSATPGQDTGYSRL
jgi:Protein of unknown function (DUF1631)